MPRTNPDRQVNAWAIALFIGLAEMSIAALAAINSSVIGDVLLSLLNYLAGT